jgi:HK97 family phage major capsid protein
VDEDQYVGDVLRDIRAELVEANQRGRGNDLVRGSGQHDLKSDYAEERLGSRYLGPDADASLVEHVAKGGSIRSTKSPVRGNKGAGSLAYAVKALAEGTGSSGGYLVVPQLAAELTPLLRARTAVLALGATVQPVAAELDVAGLSSGASAFWVAENAAIPTSEETFDFAAVLRPKPLAALIPVSNRLLRDAAVTPSLDQALRTDLSQVIALRADLAFLRGTGSGGEPAGLLTFAGTTPAPDLGVDGADPTYDNLMDMIGGLRNVNAPMLSPGWIFSPKLITVLQKMKTSTGQYLSSDPNLLRFDPTGGGGFLLGLPFRTTSQIPANLHVGTSTDCSEIYLSSDWSEYWVGQNADLRIEVSNEASYTSDGGTTWISAFQNDQSLFRSIIWLDGAPRRPQLFSILSGVRLGS